MNSAAKILGLGLLAVVAACGGGDKITDGSGNAVVQGGGCEKIACPIGTSPKGTKSASGGAEAGGNVGLTGGSVEGRTFGEGECAIECVPPRPCCEGEKWTTTSYECAKACTSEGTDGTPPEGPEGDAEGPEGTEDDAGTEGPEGTPEPDCETICAATGRECGDKPEGCPGQCGSCDKLPEPVCLDEKTSRTFTFPKGEPPAECSPDGRCQWNSLDKPCPAPKSCIEGKCDCVPLTIKEACEDNKKDCGTIDNKCGGVVNCGECTAPNTCGGGGTDNVCGCPVCTAPETCGGGGKPGACGAPGGTVYWAKGFGGTGDDRGLSVVADTQGNIVIAGLFHGETNFGGGILTSAGGADIFLAKYDATGEHLWSKRMGGPENDYATSVAVDGKGNIIMTGSFSGTVNFDGVPLTGFGGQDIFVMMYDGSGKQVLWRQKFGGGGDDVALDVVIDSQGSMILTGSFQQTADFAGQNLTANGSESDIFLIKYDAQANLVWARRFGDTSVDQGNAVAIDAEDNIVATGHFNGSIDLGGGILTSPGGSDVYLAKFDAAGTPLWSKRFGSDSGEDGLSVSVDAQSNIFATGYFHGTVNFGGPDLTSAGFYDVYLAKFSSSGTHIWSKRFGGPGPDAGAALAVDGEGNVLISGNSSGSIKFGDVELNSAGSADVYVAKFDGGGNHVWSKLLGGSSDDDALAVAVDAQGHVVITGLQSMSVDFGGGPLTSAGGTDIFLLKLAK